jgi:hypothetical protein
VTAGITLITTYEWLTAKTVPIPIWARLSFGVAALLGAPFLAYKELAEKLAKEQVGRRPVVLLKYEWEEHQLLGTPNRVIRNKPFLLLSRDADVFDVQIQPIVRQCGTATFESISSILKGCEASIPANIQGVGVLQQHDFEILLIKEWEAGGDISTISEPIVVLVSVTYSDSQGRKFKTEHEVKYKPLHQTPKTYFKGVLAE